MKVQAVAFRSTYFVLKSEGSVISTLRGDTAKAEAAAEAKSRNAALEEVNSQAVALMSASWVNAEGKQQLFKDAFYAKEGDKVYAPYVEVRGIEDEIGHRDSVQIEFNPKQGKFFTDEAGRWKFVIRAEDLDGLTILRAAGESKSVAHDEAFAG